MKNLMKTIVPLITVVTLVACGNNGAENQDSKTDSTSHKNHDQDMSGVGATEKVAVKDDKLNAVYQHYVHLTTALINEDAAEAKIASNAIEAGAKEMEGGQKIAINAAKITSASGIEAQRTAYATLSNDFIDLVKKSGLSSGQLYVDYCPMALNDKGAFWISANKEIRNPYFGEKMMNCGEIKDSIKK